MGRQRLDAVTEIRDGAFTRVNSPTWKRLGRCAQLETRQTPRLRGSKRN